MSVKWFSSGKSVSEIYQQVNMQFAFLSSPADGDEQCHDFIKCRDFLHDAVKAHLNKIAWEIYGFVYSHGKNPPICMEAMNMLARRVINGDTKTKKKAEEGEFRDQIKHSMKLLHHYEKLAKIPKSKMVEDTDKWGNPVAIFTGDPLWMSSPFLVSAYTYLIRMGAKKLTFKDNDELMKKYKDVIDQGKSDNDIVYLRDIWNKMDVVMQNTSTLFNLSKRNIDPIYFDKKIPNQTFHDRCGIQSLCKFVSPNKKAKDFIQKELKKLKRV